MKYYYSVKMVKNSSESWTNLWSGPDVWGMAFNATKCKVMYMWTRNIKHEYKMEDHLL